MQYIKKIVVYGEHVSLFFCESVKAKDKISTVLFFYYR